MFIKGSRYRTVTQSTHLDAKGERQISLDLRFISPVTGQFLHSVADRDRLDLVGFKYYTDPRRWWLIADANPEFSFPVDLLDRRPAVSEDLTLANGYYLQRSENLVLALGAFGTVSRVASDLFSATLVVEYTAATNRPLIIEQIQRTGFRLLSSYTYPNGTATQEAFTFEDIRVKHDWDDLVAILGALPGVLAADSVGAGETLRIRYNSGQIDRPAILRHMERKGFSIVPQNSHVNDRVGERIVIPPNQAA